MRFGLDSTAPVPVAAHHAVGSTVALRYLSRSTWKVVTRAEHEADRKAGIDLVLVFEDDGRPDLHGYDGGKADAEFAVRQASEILGKPRLPLCIRFAADYDPAGRADLTDAYYDGVAAVLPRAYSGPYGGIEVVSRQANRGFKQLWQTYAWSAGKVDPRTPIFQYSNGHEVGGVGVDFDRILGTDFGQFDREPPPNPAAHPDLHHDWFYPGPFDCSGKRLAERALVIEYDRLRAHWALHHLRLVQIRSDLRLLADRLAAIVAAEGSPSGTGPLVGWNAYNRGWRYQQLLHRSQGKRYV